MSSPDLQLISYIAPAAPATRQPFYGELPFLRPEIGFTPNWYHQALGIDFGKRWHTEPAYRRETTIAMRTELRRRFPGKHIGGIDIDKTPPDLLTGVYGACVVAAIFGIEIIYEHNNWPVSAHTYLSDAEADVLKVPDLDDNLFFTELLSQVAWIAKNEGRVEGFINWQGVLNNAQRLRGPVLFMDLIAAPERARHLFDCVTTTMIAACKRLHNLQRHSGVKVDFFTMSNCLVNMVSAEHYAELLLPFDQRIADEFNHVGIHNCAWNATPYLQSYAKVPDLRYIDMGQDSDLKLAKSLFPHARRAIMYTPMDIANKTLSDIRMELIKIAREYGPCDIVAADIEAGTPDKRILDFIDLCEEIGDNAT